MQSLIRASNLWGYDELVRELGGEPGILRRRAHIEPGVELEDDAFVPFDLFCRLLETTAAELASPNFGLRLSPWQGLDILGPVAVIARNAQTLQDGLESIARYLYIHSPALRLRIEPHSAGSDLRFIYEATELRLDQLRQGYELSMANGARMIRLLGWPGAAPGVVSFMHEQMGPDAAYAEALGCPVRFGQPWCGFELPLDLAARKIDRADPETRRIATLYLETRYPPNTATLSEQVSELIRRLLPTGHCTEESVADQLAMHPRALQRSLAAEGVKYQEILDRERRESAMRYLAEPRLHLSQIAGLLGYAEQSTLNRSCRRWFGKTPRQYRAELQGA